VRLPGDEREHAGGEGVESAEMADGTLAENAAHAVDYVVGSPSGGLIDDDERHSFKGFGNLVNRAIWYLKTAASLPSIFNY